MSTMRTRPPFRIPALGPLLLVGAVACGGDNNPAEPPILTAPATKIEPAGGDGQNAPPGSPLPDSLSVLVTDINNDPVPGITVAWSVLSGEAAISPASSVTNSAGMASAELTLGAAEGATQAQATANGLSGSPVVFTETTTAGTGGTTLRVAAGGNNVPDRYSSDLWVHGNFAYTGTWGFRQELGNALNVWSLDASGAPALVRSVTVPDIGTVSDVQVTEDGRLLVLSGERGDDGGIYTYDLSDPARPRFLGSASLGAQGVHTVTLSTINGRTYAFAARNPGIDQPALVIFDVTDPAHIVRTAVVPVPPTYGMHDSFVRDGLAFVFAWDAGVIIYDVGNGISSGSPSSPVEVSRFITQAGNAGSPAVHNGWWFHNPVSGEQRYLFIGQEGPGAIGSRSSGDIHVVDVSDLRQPQEVASFRLTGAGTHNFWVDEEKQVLYAAYYNAGVIALDISGTLSGDLSSRLLSQLRPGGPGKTYTWGVQLANGSLYAIDMLSGFWQLKTE
jgi:hypothetical protein